MKKKNHQNCRDYRITYYIRTVRGLLEPVAQYKVWHQAGSALEELSPGAPTPLCGLEEFMWTASFWRGCFLWGKWLEPHEGV